MQRLNPKDDAQLLIAENISVIRRFLQHKDVFQKSEEAFKSLFKEYSGVHHNDSFHGNETLLYHQYMVMHSFNTLMNTLNSNLDENDKFVNTMKSLFDNLENKTSFGRSELKKLFLDSPSGCSKNLQVLIFLATVFHDVGKLYNTERWVREYADEKLLLRKFERHDDYGWFFFRMLESKRVDKVMDKIAINVNKKLSELNLKLSSVKEKERPELLHRINLLKIDLFYLNECKQRIIEFGDVIRELELNKADFKFIAFLIDHHQALFNDPSMDYANIKNEKDVKKIKNFIVWARTKKFEKLDIVRKNRKNDFIFYGLMFINLSDCNGTGFSDHSIEYAFKTYKLGDVFEGHHGNIENDAEFFGFLNYLYHNLNSSDVDIVKNWFGLVVLEKTLNWKKLLESYPDKYFEIKKLIEQSGVQGLKEKGFDVANIMKILNSK